MDKKNLLFLDTETTGIGAMDRLCQLAYAFEGEEAEALFKPPVPISIDAMVVTHITNRMVAENEPFVGSVLSQKLQATLAAGAILVAHNAKFDIDMLKRESIEVTASIDTFKLAHHLDGAGVIPHYSLQYLRYYHDLEVAEAVAHSALGDVRVLEKLFDFYFAQMLTLSGDEAAVIREMRRISDQPILLKKFTFGKYVGRDVSEVATEDARYLSWLLSQKIMARERGEENDENWIYTLDHYLPHTL